MMSIRLPSQHDLIPHLGVLDKLLVASLQTERVSSVQRQTEQLPYYLRGACAAIHQLESARRQAITVLSEPGVGPHAQFILPNDKIDPLSFAFEFYLFCLRRALDALIPYISRCPKNVSLPASLSDLFDGINKNRYEHIDSTIQRLVVTYWKEVGWRIKGYRDQANHKAIILSNCTAFNGKDGIAWLRMLLPDNPEETSPSKLRYQPGVPAMKFALDTFQKTVRFANTLVERMIDLIAPGDLAVRNSGIVSIAMRGAPLKLESTISGEPVPYPFDLSTLVATAAMEASSAGRRHADA